MNQVSPTKTTHVGEQVHWVIITLRAPAGVAHSEKICWRDLPWAVRCKWDWYFKYRAALAQVQKPRWDVHLAWGHSEATGQQLAYHRQNVVRAKKGKITEYVNKMARWKEGWTNLFPIEDQPFWKAAEAKIARTRQELADAEELLLNTPAT